MQVVNYSKLYFITLYCNPELFTIDIKQFFIFSFYIMLIKTKVIQQHLKLL